MTVILLDFWGVIGIVQTRDDLAGMARRLGAPTEDFIEAYWANRAPYDAGATIDEYWGVIARGLGVALDEQTLQDLVSLDTRSWSGVDQSMLALIDELRGEGHRLALLSNAPHELVEHASSVLAGRVPELLFSSQLGLAKPDPLIYRRALAHLNVSADEVLFVDDSLVNVQAAQAQGLGVIHHRTVQQTREQIAAWTSATS